MLRMDKAEFYAHVGMRIRVRRSLMGMSQKQLAKATGISPYLIKRYEAGTSKITMDRLDLITKMLGVSEQYFLSRP